MCSAYFKKSISHSSAKVRASRPSFQSEALQFAHVRSLAAEYTPAEYTRAELNEGQLSMYTSRLQ
jgi:hypothetical protein